MGEKDGIFRLSAIALPAYGPSLLFGIAQGALVPVIVLSAMERGASSATAALVAGLIGIGLLVADLPSGALAQRFGEKRAMLMAMLAAMAGLATCVLPLSAGAPALIVYGGGILLFGMAGSVFHLARQSYLTELVPIGMRARALSTLGGSMRIGMFLGPFAGAGAMVLIGRPGAYIVGLVALAASGVIIVAAPDLESPAQSAGPASRVALRDVLRRYRGVLASIGLGVLLLSALRQTRQTVVPLWAAELGLGPAETSLIYGLAGALDALVFYPTGWVMDRYGRRPVAVASTLVLAAAFVALPWSCGPVLMTVIACVMGVGNGIGAGLVMTLGADAARASDRRVFLGIWRGVGDTGSAAGPLALAALTAVAGPSFAIMATGLLGFAAAGVFARWVPRQSRA
ncbi:MFS transporter [Microbacterium rhizophilus]|uniref:MFS transporter n=1 Tax=Microbacterium rhizophilus TaxID=3138934 RepID=UPI0031EC0323